MCVCVCVCVCPCVCVSQVGALMMENLLDISWEDVQQAVPAFLTIALIPLSYSIGE